MADLLLSEVGRRVRSQRLYLGFTREDLAERLGITPKFCADIELGQKGMSLQTLCRLSHILHLSTDYILFGREDSTNPDELLAMLRHCPPEKVEYVKELLKIFLQAVG